MSEYIKTALKITWIIVAAYWMVSSISAKKPLKQEGFVKRFVQYWLPLIVAALLLGNGDWYGHSWLREKFVPHHDLVGLIGLALSIAGAVIACWARYSLGSNWSVSVQEKEHHALIQGGVYRWVRHPIYSGLLLLFTGNALIVGDYRGIVAVAVIFVSFWLKLKKEEKILAATFGEQYDAYKDGTKALIPFVL